MIEIRCLLRSTGGPGIKTPQEKPPAVKPSAVESALKRRRRFREASYSARRRAEAWPRKKGLSEYHHAFPQFQSLGFYSVEHNRTEYFYTALIEVWTVLILVGFIIWVSKAFGQSHRAAEACQWAIEMKEW